MNDNEQENEQDQPKRNPYIRLDNHEYWKWKPDWYSAGNRMSWYENIDMNAIAEASNDDVVDLIHRLVSYTRTRDRVIEQRQSVAFHVGFMLRFILYTHQGTKYTVEELLGVLKMLREYLIQMQVVSATDTPDAPGETRLPG